MNVVLHIGHSVGYALGLVLAWVSGGVLSAMIVEPAVRRHFRLAVVLFFVGVVAVPASCAIQDFCPVEHPHSAEKGGT